MVKYIPRTVSGGLRDNPGRVYCMKDKASTRATRPDINWIYKITMVWYNGGGGGLGC